ncbi:MAG: CCA tRNA nucleotidyltransferase [Candidatus Bathyarchaeota archaeon]|nr:CCA tRNA nucleotidyltransferase [Candidatus Bathyarchaeota archaeon]
MPKDIAAICSEILEKITPTKEKKAKIEALVRKLERKVAAACTKRGVKATVRAEGSVAKDTWLNEDPDIDVFMRLPASIDRKTLGKISLEIAREATEGSRQVERFAEHPYLEAFVDNVRVNIVPCYAVKQGEWLSATDRTPFHTDYAKKHLNQQLRSEVRLLKKFMQGIGVYGAEIKTGGFSGYLCELLVLHYESFTETLKTFAQYTQRIIIDIENYYSGRQNGLQLLFNEPLVIIDPVDKARNVASAVQSEKLYTFIGAAREFLKSPSTEFFYPPKTKALPLNALQQQLDNCGAAYVFLLCAIDEAVPDVLWGQLYRTQRSLRKLLELNDFRVLRNAVWSDEKTLSIFIFELEQRFLPSVKKHLGPPLTHENECTNFLAKYAQGNSNVISGPCIEDGRWTVELKRRYTDVVSLLAEKLKEGGKNTGVAKIIAQALKEKISVLVNTEIAKVYSGNEDFAAFLTSFLRGKPLWLDAAAE